MRTIFIRLICCFVPSRTLRHKIRHPTLPFINNGTNNTVEIISSDGKSRTITKLRNSHIKFTGNDNHIKLYEPLGKLYLDATVSNGTTIILAPSVHTRHINIYKEHGQTTDNNIINIGRDFRSTAPVKIQLCQGSGNITIGAECLFSWEIEIRVGDWHTITDTNGETINHNQDVTIGNHVWCGSNVMILKGAVIPDNCVIGTRSLITRKFDTTNCVIAGQPAKVIKQNISWDAPTPRRTDNMVP